VPYDVRLMARAEHDIDTALQWFCEQSATPAANRWFDQLMARIGTLEVHPDRCSLAAEAQELGIELRELLFDKRHGTYRILFIISAQTVNILHIRHGARSAATAKDIQ
jgi:plasmid stabilization system protein ParE